MSIQDAAAIATLNGHIATLETRLREAIVALDAAHREEGVCWCPGEWCVLGNKWAVSILREPRT